VVEKPPIKDIDKDKENKTKGDVIPTQEVVKAASKQVESDVRKPKVVRDDIIKLDKDKGTVSSKEIFHKQNLGNHSQEISDYLKGNLKKERSNSKEVEKYSVLTYMVYNNTTDGVTTLADLNDKVIDVRGNEDYNLSSVKEMLGEIIVESNLADSAVVNHRIHDSGFTEGKNVDDVWIFSNPNIKTRYIVHSEIDKSFAVINQENDIVNLDGKPMVYEGDNYNMENLEKILNVVKK
jgi:urease gamma subunit